MTLHNATETSNTHWVFSSPPQKNMVRHRFILCNAEVNSTPMNPIASHNNTVHALTHRYRFILTFSPPIPTSSNDIPTNTCVVGSKSFRPDQLFKVTETKHICRFSTESPFTSTHFSHLWSTSKQMALYIPHSIFLLARLLYVRPETFGPYYVSPRLTTRNPEGT